MKFLYTQMMHKKPLNSGRKRGIPKDFRLLTTCPLCKASYKPAQALVLDERGGRHLLHIECGKCGNSVLALFLSGAGGASSVGVVTDLTGADVIRFKDAYSVSPDDVISLHESLKEESNFIEKLKDK